MLVDTHCHLGAEQFTDDRDLVVARARAAGVGHVVVVADSLPATEDARAIARQYGFSATAGVHPHNASSWSAASADALQDALRAAEVVAVGETGLDYHYDFSPREAQRAAFAEQLGLGSAHDRPVVVHARDADADMAAMLRDTDATVILHSFSSGRGVFEAGMEIGAYFSFSGMVTFKRWDGLDFVRECPSDRLLVETDAPYLAPVPHRGARNEPAFVTHVAARIAEIRDLAVDAVVSQTSNNARACFGPRIPSGLENPA